MKHLPWKLAGAALSLAILFDILFYKTASVGINVLLMQIAILGVSIGFAKYANYNVSKGAWISSIFALLFAGTFAIWTSELGLTLSGLGLASANVFFALFLLGHRGKFHHPAHAALDGVRYLAETYVTRLSIFGDFKIPAISFRSSAVLRGLIIATPIVIIFLALFLGSDLILQQRASGLTDWLENFVESGDVIAHVAIIGFFTIVFLLFFAGAFWKRLKIDELKELTVKHNIESGIILVALNALFFAFIAFQAVYLFGGQSAWDNIEGITYSEYAVAGFNELATVAALVILLILTLRYFHTERTNRKLVHGAELILIVETLAIVFSAWKRMALYVAQYDFSPARLFGFWFFIVAAVVLILLAYHILRRIPQYKFIQQSAIAIGIFMLAFTASAPDALSVKLNANRMEDGTLAAFPLFNRLSAEAFDEMIAVLTDENIDIGVIELNDYCDQLEPTYINGRVDFPNLFSLNNPRRGLNVFEAHWDDAYYNPSSLRYEGKGEPIKEPLDDWRTWNLSRSSIPRNAIHAIPYDLSQEIYGTEIVAAACGIPTTNSDYVPPAPITIPAG